VLGALEIRADSSTDSRLEQSKLRPKIEHSRSGGAGVEVSSLGFYTAWISRFAGFWFGIRGGRLREGRGRGKGWKMKGR